MIDQAAALMVLAGQVHAMPAVVLQELRDCPAFLDAPDLALDKSAPPDFCCARAPAPALCVSPSSLSGTAHRPALQSRFASHASWRSLLVMSVTTKKGLA
jgi:hypothetical protein